MAERADEHLRLQVSSTLLMRLRQRDPAAWERLVQLYGPLVYHWCRRAGVSAADAPDVFQEVFRSVANGLARDFEHGRDASAFPRWLAVITRHRICDHFRRQRERPEARGGTDFQIQIQQWPSPEPVALEAAGPAPSERARLVRRALRLIQSEFEPRTWTMFWRTTVDGACARDVAAELEVTLNAVYKAKSRVLRRLRLELEGLV